MTVIKQLKANLFELTYVMDDESRQNIMDSLCEKVRETLATDGITFYIYNRMKLDKRVDHYTSNSYNTPMQKLVSNSFLDIFHRSSSITVLEKNHPLSSLNHNVNILLKLNKTEYFYSFVIMNFDEQQSISEDILNQVRFVLEQFLTSLFNNRHHKFIYRRYQSMFELSTKLHSIHHTNDVLAQVNETTKTMYPNYDYNFLMAHEVECGNLPVKIIEYSQETTLNPGIITLINNELQFEYDEKNKRSKIYSPMSGNQGVYGVFQLIVPQVIEFVDSEIQFLLEYTNMIGRAIERTTLYQSSNQQVSDLQIINVASHEFNENLQLDEISTTVKKHIFNSCFPEQIGVVLFQTDETDDTIEILEQSTSYFSTESGKIFVEMMHERLEQEAKPFLSGDYQAEFIEFPYKSLMVIPMKSSESVLGMIIITHKESYYFSFDKYKFIQSLVQHASLAFTNSILAERLKQIATTDHLTKLYARNHMDELIHDHMQESERGALILFDVDDFKQINDTYGHYIGDKVLIQVANIIQSEMKEGQFAGRWGGEEFAVYLSDVTLEESTAKANIIREKVMENTNPNVSLSSGVSIWEKGFEDSIEKLFIRADKALYEAKTSGKNKVVQNVEIV